MSIEKLVQMIKAVTHFRQSQTLQLLDARVNQAVTFHFSIGQCEPTARSPGSQLTSRLALRWCKDPYQTL